MNEDKLSGWRRLQKRDIARGVVVRMKNMDDGYNTATIINESYEANFEFSRKK